MAVQHPLLMRQQVGDLVCTMPSGNLIFRPTGSTPSAPGTAIATLPLSATAFGASNASAVSTANSITQDSNATGGTVAFATLGTSGGVVHVHCAVAASGSDINMSGGLVVGAGDIVSCSSLTYTAMP